MEDAVTASPAIQASAATLVVVGSTKKLAEAADVARSGAAPGALRIVLISTASNPPPELESQPDVISIAGLRPEFVNNAIAGVRLSSLPTVVWWRGGRTEGVDGVASLADRVILDVEDPWPIWRRVETLFEHAAFTDIRWARLTRWRAAMAHFFDLPEVLEVASTFGSLTIAGTDRPRAALFAGWIDASLGGKEQVRPELLDGRTAAPLESVTLRGRDGELVLQLHPSQTCLDTQARVDTRVIASRVVSAGDQRLPALLSEELRVRSRDLAFERALRAALSYSG
jgi:glucose-6-phosphate dehydrogenase assembly protein OpcA